VRVANEERALNGSPADVNNMGTYMHCGAHAHREELDESNSERQRHGSKSSYDLHWRCYANGLEPLHTAIALMFVCIATKRIIVEGMPVQ